MAKTTIYGAPFDVSDAYAEGHVLNAKEAAALSGLRAELIGHRIRAFLREDHGFDKDTSPSDHPEAIEAARAKLAEFEASFEFGAARTGGGARAPKYTPLEELARKFATDMVNAKLKQSGLVKGKKDGSTDHEAGVYPLAQYNAKVDEVAAKPSVIEKAKKALAAASKTEVEDFTI